jgi:phosphinothricin acetyltransferase
VLTTRLARAEDSAAIAAIYNQGIEDRIATFETEPRSPDQVARILAEAPHPAVVVEAEGNVVGFAWASNYSPRPCYAGIAEHSVYVSRAARRRGVGRLALEGVMRESARNGAHKLVSRIFTENVASRELHRKVGFREVGVHERHGQIDGEWKDCVVVELLLD